MITFKKFSRCAACHQSPAVLFSLSLLVVLSGVTTTVVLTAEVDSGEPAPTFTLTPDIIKGAIQQNGNNPVCFPGGGSAWFGSSADCAGQTMYNPEDFGLQRPGGSAQSEPTSEQIKEAIQKNNGHAVCLPPGSGWQGNSHACAGYRLYTPEEYGLPPAPGAQQTGPTEQQIRDAIIRNDNHPVCMPGGGTAWKSGPECDGERVYAPEEFGLERAGTSETGLTSERIRNAIQGNNGHPVCFPNGTGWMSGSACDGQTMYKPEDYGLSSAPDRTIGVPSPEEIKKAILQNSNYPVCFEAGSTGWNGNTNNCTGRVYTATDVGLQGPAPDGHMGFGNGGPMQMGPMQAKQMAEQAVRECENLKRPLTEGYMPEDMRGKMKGPVQAVVDECIAAAKNAIASAEKNPMAIGTFFQSMPLFYQKLETVLRSQSSCMGVAMQVRGMKEGAKGAELEISHIKKTKPDTAAEMDALRKETLEVAKQAEAFMTSSQCQKAQELMRTHQERMHASFKKWGHASGDVSFMDKRAATTEFAHQIGEGEGGVNTLMKHYDVEELQFASEILNLGGKDLVALLKDEQTANLIKTMSKNSGQAAVTVAMMQRIKELETKVSTLEHKLTESQQRYAKELLALTPAPETGRFIEDFVQNQLSALEGLPPEAIRKIVDEYKRRNGEELKNLGIVKFSDTDPKDWYTPHAAKVSDAGIITGEGDTGNFNPAGLVNGAQFAKILATAMGLEPVEGTTSDDPRFAQYPSWSQGYIVALEEAGMQFGEYVSVDPAKPVEKIQLATALAQLIDEGNFKKSGFSKVFTDLGGRSDQEKQAVAALSMLGIVSGENNGDTFQPKANVSRAVLAKMIGNMLNMIADSGKQR